MESLEDDNCRPSTTSTENVLDNTEQELGIIVYLNNAKGFSAVLKARYSDFLVHEVGTDGSVARLESMEATLIPLYGKLGTKVSHPVTRTPPNDLDHPNKRSKIDNKVTKQDELDAAASRGDDSFPRAGESSSEIIDWAAVSTALHDLVGQEPSQSVVSFLQQDEAAIEPENPYVVLPHIGDKETRKSVHSFVRSRLEPLARSDTLEGCVRIWHKNFEHRMPNYQKYDSKTTATSNLRIPSRRDRGTCNGDYGEEGSDLQFVLYKENMDTTSAIQNVRNVLNGPQQQRHGNKKKRWNHNNKLRIGYAGMKDKRGVTCQLVTVKVMQGQLPHRLIDKLCQRWNSSRSSDCGGGHTQNKGTCILRVGNFKMVDSDLKLGDLQGNRFDVVLRNLQSVEVDVRNAAEEFRQSGFVNYFGTQRFGKYCDTHKVGIAVLKGDYKAAIDIIMSPKDGEASQHRDARVDWQSRFSSVESETDRAILEQQCATNVIKRLGKFMNNEVAVLQSLILYPLNYERAFGSITRTMRMMFIHAVQSHLWNHLASFRLSLSNDDVLVGDLVMTGGPASVQVVNGDDVEASRFTLNDLVLPLYGKSSILPENKCKESFETLLAEHGLTKAMFDRLSERELDLSGDYRKIVCHPEDIDFEILHYTDPLQPLIQTDLMLLQDIPIETIQSSVGLSDVSPTSSFLRAIRIGFTLPSSSYATIALRELMKRPTSSEYQGEQQLGANCK